MYLKEIQAHGFKSFADKTNIELKEGISGIVGPNGSGKSNVVDAVRWVLGEQSVKSLRGDGNMTDVIFSGSKSRNAQNVASVTLLFDNTDHYLPVEFTEIAVRRRVYKDGTNEYSLNGEKCRLKDITDILLDTGIAKESFNIISQGKIEEIISSKPNERRVIFEEAAGVLKYKRRKEDALRKLDRTHDNMTRVEDIIHELEVQVAPLKEQKEQALAYNETKALLENTEIALIATDITGMNAQYQEKKKQIDIVNEELLHIGTSNSSNEAKIEAYKLKLNQLDEQFNTIQKEWIHETTLLEQVNSEKQILLERKKYEVEDTRIHDNMVLLEEQTLKIENELHALMSEIVLYKESLSMLVTEKETLYGMVVEQKNMKHHLENDLSEVLRKQTILNHQIDQLHHAIEHNSSLPYAVKSVLDNPKIKGIHHVIGKLFEVSEEYTCAITTSLGGSSNYLVVDNEAVAKSCIQYLKNNALGRATFFPLNVIKPKGIEDMVRSLLEKMDGYQGIASELVKYNREYHNIICNQLGNVIVARDIDSANMIRQKTGARYKIVTLDGDLIHVGGSMTGGKANNMRNVIQDKYELEKAQVEKTGLVSTIEQIEHKMNDSDANLKSLEDKLYLLEKELIEKREIVASKEQQQIEVTEKQRLLISEKEGASNILNHKLGEEEEKIIHKYYEVQKNKVALESKLNVVKQERTHMAESLSEYEFSLKQENSAFNQKSKILKELEIVVNRLDVKLDTLLTTLSETYSLTYEKAQAEYHLEEEVSSARLKVSRYKEKLKQIGIVNLGAIEEYDRVSERFEFLKGQKDDLIHAEDTLLEIIQEMDGVMETEFIKTFEVIRKHFTETFQELFKGGTASLKLTDEDNILETGIEIVASPPGKKLTSISLLSGGEKTFTAISLLFAILKSRPVPFCILDEVEAALDEANVESFGKYIVSLKSKTQFILITHKKKTMEFVDILYGITMQESGVSKLVSVKLEELKD